MKKFRFGMLITLSLLVVITFVFSVAMADEDFLVYLPMVIGGNSEPPAITSQPADQTVVEGQTATFSVTASGTAPLSYQWQRWDGAAWADIGGATSASYTTPATTLADDGAQFRVQVSNTAGSVDSNAATLTVQATPPGVHILDNDTHYVDDFGLLNVVAEVENSTADTVNLDSITVNFYDASDNLLETELGIVVLDNLPANEKTCFDVELIEPSGWSYYEIESPSYLSIGDIPFPNLTVLNDSFSFNPILGGFWEIAGEVRNDHGSTVDDVVLVGTLYNAAGDVIGCDSELFDVFSLDPGETDNFDISFVGRDYADYDSHRVQADGDTLP